MGRPAQIVHLKITGPKSLNIPRGFWMMLLLIPLIGVGIAAAAIAFGFSSVFRAIPKPPTPPLVRSTPTKTEPRGGPQPEKSIATVMMKFGSKGIGPGMFTDARSIAVDGAGNIYVGEYSGGRVQVFDPDGKFVTQWTVDPKMPLRGLAADRKGTVFVVQSGSIQKHEGATGNPIGQLKFAEGWGFDDVITTPDGGLITTWQKNTDDIVKFDQNGNTVKRIKAAISSVTGDSELDMRIAADGLGNIYALGTFNNAVFKFGPDGKYLNRFGGSGDQPGQFRAPGALAVDGNGRVFVSDIQGIQMFDSNGRYLDTFKADGSNASGMVFNDKNELFVVAREKVIKLALKQ